jgi:hypothetical protein
MALAAKQADMRDLLGPSVFFAFSYSDAEIGLFSRHA